MSEQEPKTPKEPIDTSLLNRLDIRRPNDPDGLIVPMTESEEPTEREIDNY